jgi:hypothetical protein
MNNQSDKNFLEQIIKFLVIIAMLHGYRSFLVFKLNIDINFIGRLKVCSRPYQRSVLD